MPTKRTSTYAASAMTQAAIRKLIADNDAAALETQTATMANTKNTNRNTRPRETHIERKGKYKELISCQPFYFNGLCTVKCQTCNKAGHLTKNCKNKGPATGSNLLPVSITCHACEAKGYYRNQCPKENNSAHGRAYLLRDKKSHRDPNIVTAHVMEKKSDEKQLEDIPIVREFREVYLEDLPGLPPVHHVEFQIDLILRITPVARAPYRLALLEMQELSDQLQELADRECQKPSGLLIQPEIPTWKWERITMDLFTKLPRTSNAYDTIWVIVDRLTKSAHFIPTRETKSMETLTRLYIKEIASRHRVPIFIISDRDSHFTSRFWQ
uniref:Reverse transcriptase domain-containing protein n=1 Tax=Tanacetum cinerariifolium TaxID=118510 RepID=A0A699GXC7_TANCI|nr:reverse transcriptase domain-containing protein [Tanacetum cinerariifolium]